MPAEVRGESGAEVRVILQLLTIGAHGAINRSPSEIDVLSSILTQTPTQEVVNIMLSTPQTVAQNAPLAAEMDTYLQAHYETGRFMGTAIVSRKRETVFARGYGFASLEHEVTNTPQTKFRIGSISKQFTAAAILQLQDRGLLDVQSPVATYLPDYPNGESITIHHLLTHTAGIPNLTSFPDYLEWMKLPTTLEALIGRFRDLPLEFAPGEQYRYSNSGYVLLTQVIETVSGQSYADYLQEHLLLPLGLDNTGYEHPVSVIDGLANGYQFTGEDYQRAEYINMDVPAGAGGLYSTVDDLVQWNQFLIDADHRPSGILSDAAITAMKTPQIPMGEDTPELSYGYGLIVGARGFIFHGGGINGFLTYLGSLPDQGITVAVLSNVENANPSVMAEDLLAILKGQPYELPTNEEAVTIAPEVLERYVGTYQVTPEIQVVITIEEVERHYYSVPYWFARQEVSVKVSEQFIEVFYDHQRIAAHPRAQSPYRHTTVDDHMPPEHWAYKHQSKERFLAWARQVGPQTYAQVEAVFEHKAHEEQAFRTIKGIQRLATHYGYDRLEATCRRANLFKMTGLRRLKAILNAHLDEVPPPVEAPDSSVIVHDNVRGQSYYR